MLSRIYDEQIAELATGKQLEAYKLWCKGSTSKQMGKEIGVSHQVAHTRIKALEKKATLRGKTPAYSEEFGAGEGRHVKKVTTHIKDGQTVQEWIRTDNDAENVIASVIEAVKVLAEEVKGKSKAVTLKVKQMSDLVSLYPLFDKHTGMLAWDKETGKDYDLQIAQEQETETFTSLVDSQPASAEALIVFGGDYFHCDDDNQVTPAHHNKVDTDGRSHKVFGVGVGMARKYVALALAKHQHITVEVIPGNHDPVLSMALLYVLESYYDGNERVTVRNTPNPFTYYEFGNTLLAFQHGEKMKHERMYQCVTTDKREAWGRVKYCHVFSGHFHREQKVDIGLCTMESLRTTIPNEAYSHAAGYRSPRTAYAITFSKDGGEVGRTTRNI